MFTTTVSVVRSVAGAATTVATGLQVQVDQASDREVVEHAQIDGRRVADLFKVYTLWWPSVTIQRADVLYDALYTDPQTGQPFKYRVVSRPKNFMLDHQELLAEVVPGA